MTPRGMEWTDAHSVAATNEGWDIFDVNGSGYLEIQRVDELDVFDSDEEAVRFVRHNANAGSDERYLIALTIHEWYAGNATRPELWRPAGSDH